MSTLRMKAAPSPTVLPEHWLTLMTCTKCSKTPDAAPVYKCLYGHVLCYVCFQAIVRSEVPTCQVCGSDEFNRHDVSADFLYKLKTKPGIGRTCRYPPDVDGEEESSEQLVPASNTLVTVEELFQLPAQRLRSLAIAKTTTGRRSEDRKAAGEGVVSRKPVKCPHSECGKTVAISSFRMHFKYEHIGLKCFQARRSLEISMSFDAACIELGKSTCIGIVALTEKEEDTFWIMVTGASTATYVLFWLFTTTEERTHSCTMELSSQSNVCTMTTFCRVCDVYDSQVVDELEQKMSCLFVTYGTLRHMLTYGPRMKFRLIIH